jgi:phospholipid transport system substrate-binding protein
VGVYNSQGVLVRSLVRSSGGGEPVQVDYGMEKTDDGWKVYNVKIGGISLVENYRGTFNTEIFSPPSVVTFTQVLEPVQLSLEPKRRYTAHPPTNPAGKAHAPPWP